MGRPFRAAAGLPPGVPRWRTWLLAFACWTLIGVFFSSQTFVSYGYFRRNVSWSRALELALTEYYLWALLSIPILWLARKLPFERERWGRALAVHLPLSIAVSVLHLAALSFIAARINSTPAKPVATADLFRSFLGQKIHPGVLIYWVIAGVSHTLSYYRRYRERELRASQLETRLAEARLEVLKMQLHPHFLFNTLHAISTLMHRDVEKADQMLARLSDLLRMALEDSSAQEVTLQRELDFVERYLAIEKTRFADRLQVHFEIDPAMRDARVPNLILQPLVENAVRHGIAPRSEGGSITVRATRPGTHLRIEISDDGAGVAEGLREGVGLSNTRARLAQMYPQAHLLKLEPGSPRGLRVSMEIPFRT